MNSTLTSTRANEFKPDDSVEVIIALNGGACFGVVRAIKLGQSAAERIERDQKPVYALGQLIHNPKVVAELEDKGVQTVDSVGEAPVGTVILRSHGIKKEDEAGLRKKGFDIVDATCPLVKKPQRIAQSLGNKGYFLVLVGDINHPEVKGVVSYFAKDQYLVTYNPADVDKIPADVKKVGIVAQTTIEVKMFDTIVDTCKKRFPEVSVYNTICDATSIRQSEAQILAQKADVMVVVGGRNSSNTNKLVKICKQYQSDTHLIEELTEIKPQWFVGKRKIGVTGGASTPMDYVDAVGESIVKLLS